MTEKILVPDIGDFENVEVIELLVKVESINLIIRMNISIQLNLYPIIYPF